MAMSLAACSSSSTSSTDTTATTDAPQTTEPAVEVVATPEITVGLTTYSVGNYSYAAPSTWDIASYTDDYSRVEYEWDESEDHYVLGITCMDVSVENFDFEEFFNNFCDDQVSGGSDEIKREWNGDILGGRGEVVLYSNKFEEYEYVAIFHDEDPSVDSIYLFVLTSTDPDSKNIDYFYGIVDSIRRN